MKRKNSIELGSMAKGSLGDDDEFTYLNEDELNASDVDVDESEEVDEVVDEESLYGSECIQDEDDGNIKHWIPHCPLEFKPSIGMVFKNIEEAEGFYREYAKRVGFDAKSSTSHRLRRSNVFGEKYYRCTREGSNPTKNGTGVRNTTSKKIGCDARFVVKPSSNGAYKCHQFEERHNHDMIPYYARHFLKANRKLNIGHQKFMLSCAKANLGPVKSHKVLKELVGGYCHVGAMQSDFKNFKRDIMAYINEADAQMVIDRFKKKKELSSAFYFEYDVNECGQLKRLFWCDAIARRNYAAFGDVVSFDSTYRTNKYCMVFAPFTGMDNHKKSVTFACGLLMKEDVESYTWLFEKFQQAMQTKDPIVMVTDQDPAMKIAIEKVFPQTRHRLCMWHIMEKVSVKVGAKKINSGRFRLRMGTLVWTDKLTISAFEEGWKTFIHDYELGNKQWFADMYAIRESWVPAYFRDIVLGGLIRTTSISESQNNFFGRYSSSKYSLVELLMQFDTAMDSQRHIQLNNDVDSDTKHMEAKTPLCIEKHAAEYYTLRVFAEVQEEIYASCFTCNVKSEMQGVDHVLFIIKEGNNIQFNVEYRELDEFTKCSCLMFNKVGISCRHIFTALKSLGKEKIPRCLLLSRWMKGAAKNVNGPALEEVLHQSVLQEENKALVGQVWSVMLNCIGMTQDDKDKLQDLLSKMLELESSYKPDDNGVGTVESTLNQMVENFAGISRPREIVVKPPDKAKNKGS